EVDEPCAKARKIERQCLPMLVDLRRDAVPGAAAGTNQRVRDSRRQRGQLVVMDDGAFRDQDAGCADPRLEMVFEQRVEVGVQVGWTPALAASRLRFALCPQRGAQFATRKRLFVANVDPTLAAIPAALCPKTRVTPRGTLAGGLFHNVAVLREPKRPAGDPASASDGAHCRACGRWDCDLSRCAAAQPLSRPSRAARTRRRRRRDSAYRGGRRYG